MGIIRLTKWVIGFLTYLLSPLTLQAGCRVQGIVRGFGFGFNYLG